MLWFRIDEPDIGFKIFLFSLPLLLLKEKETREKNILSHDLSSWKVIHLVEICKHRKVSVSIAEDENTWYLVIKPWLCVYVINVCTGIHPDAFMCCVHVRLSVHTINTHPLLNVYVSHKHNRGCRHIRNYSVVRLFGDGVFLIQFTFRILKHSKEWSGPPFGICWGDGVGRFLFCAARFL